MAAPFHEVLTQLQNLRLSLPQPNEQSQHIREELLLEARQLLLSLEQTHNVVERICFQLWETIACQIAIDLGLFVILEKKDCTSSAEDLAKETNADPVFLGRLLRCLASYGAIKEEGVNTYSSTIVSKTFSIDVNKAAMEGCLQFLSPGWLKAPAFHKHNGYQNPTDALKTAFAMAYGRPEGAPLYEILMGTPHLHAMSVYVANFNEGHKDWFDFYPVEARLNNGVETESSAVMMVDVGGGRGSQAIGLKKKFPQLLGRFIVQDLMSLPPESDREPGIEYVSHDFFKEQPIKGARLYYLRYIMHDWPQKSNVEILTQLRKAMRPGYSRLIINDWILPSQGASSFMAAQDMNMMSAGGGMERTEDLHQEYIEAAGLKISGIYYPDDRISEGVIEAEAA